MVCDEVKTVHMEEKCSLSTLYIICYSTSTYNFFEKALIP